MPTSDTYNQDCLEAMRQMRENEFDLAIVDPPYGIGADKGTGKYGRLKFTLANKKWDSATPTSEYFTELFRISLNQIIFGGNYFPLPQARGFIIWDKGAGFRNRDFAECEFAWTSFDRNAKIFSYDPLANGDFHNGKKISPAQKPVALYKWLLKNYAKEGDKILDTHLGSGSSRIAAYDLGFDFTGYELDFDYWTWQEERFARHIAQPKLFEPVPEVEKQDSLFE